MGLSTGISGQRHAHIVVSEMALGAHTLGNESQATKGLEIDGKVLGDVVETRSRSSSIHAITSKLRMTSLQVC